LLWSILKKKEKLEALLASRIHDLSSNRCGSLIAIHSHKEHSTHKKLFLFTASKLALLIFIHTGGSGDALMASSNLRKKVREIVVMDFVSCAVQ